MQEQELPEWIPPKPLELELEIQTIYWEWTWNKHPNGVNFNFDYLIENNIFIGSGADTYFYSRNMIY